MAMAGNLFGVDMPRPRGSREENLLGIDGSGDIGMTDSAFQRMGRAPVDELWAGRYSAAIDDEEFDELVKLAEAARQEALESKPVHMSGPAFALPQAENDWVQNSRDYISDRSGLDLYPGHLRSDVENPIFMSEFSDAGSAFREGSFEDLAAAAEKGDGLLLGDVFDHPELYKHYPEAQFLPVGANKSMEDGHRGSYFSPTEERPLGAMHLNPNYTPEESRETLLHELQHFIQRAEGWEGGGGVNPQTGHAFAQHVADTSVNHPDSPQAQGLLQEVDDLYEGSEEVMDFMKNEELYQNLAGRAYGSLSGEQLARDATNRDAAGVQVDNYYRGATDVYNEGEREYENWNHTGASFTPMAVMPSLRQELAENGLLGPIKLDKDGNPIRMDRVDPYVGQYLKEMKSLEK